MSFNYTYTNVVMLFVGTCVRGITRFDPHLYKVGSSSWFDKPIWLKFWCITTTKPSLYAIFLSIYFHQLCDCWHHIGTSEAMWNPGPTGLDRHVGPPIWRLTGLIAYHSGVAWQGHGETTGETTGEMNLPSQPVWTWKMQDGSLFCSLSFFLHCDWVVIQLRSTEDIVGRLP